MFGAWRTRADTHMGLIDGLVRHGIIKSPRVEVAMRAVDRGYYALTNAYIDAPSPIGYGQTISAPHMHAESLEVLHDNLVPGAQALDVGSGSGYLAAAMATMVGKNGHVLGIDIVPELVTQSMQNVQKGYPNLLTEGLLEFKCANGWEEIKGEFDAIHVGAAAATLPQPLVQALKPGGLMVIPLGVEDQTLCVVKKTKTGEVSTSRLCGVRFVPLVKKVEDIGTTTPTCKSM